jgi:arylsulfatase A-like enzyme
MHSRPTAPITPLREFLLLGAWFGIVTGLIEGFGFLLFQHINWQNWGRMMHVSSPILWISPVLDLFLFSALALVCFVLARVVPKLPAMRVLLFLLVGLAVYDWLTVTHRLWHSSCLLLALGAAVAFNRWFATHEHRAMRFWQLTFPAVAALFLITFLVVAGGAWWRERRTVANLPTAPAGSPNVLVIVLDALRADHVSAYGYPRSPTPDIDRLAAEGALFENAIATASWSLPSHASLVTGRYPFEHGAENIRATPWFGSPDPAFSGYTTLGQALEHRGYRTGAFSANLRYFTANSGFQTAFLHFDDYFDTSEDSIVRTLFGREFLRISGRFSSLLRKRADVVNRDLLRWIDRDHQRPFFAFLNYFDVHAPYGGPRKYPKPPWRLKTTADSYDAGLKYDNDYIAALMTELERRGMARNTLVVVTSDHGEALGQHGVVGHGGTLYWELVHVPLMIWYPGHVPAGTRVNRPVSSASIPATVMDLLNPGAGSEFPVPPLTRLWTSTTAAADWPFPLSEIARNPYPEEKEKLADQIEPTSATGWMKSLVTPQWHLIVHEQLGVQLYDWVHDTGEQNNVAETPDGRSVATALTAAMRGILGSSAPPPFSRYAETASPLHDGAFSFNPARRPGETQVSVSDYYRIAVAPGSKVSVEVAARALKPASQLDPVLAIQDGHGNPLYTCRNPGDDKLPPAFADRTPDAFDDLCMNDDSQPGVRDSRLELAVPGSSGAPLQLYVHVLDWKPGNVGRKNYRLTVSGTLP